MEQYLNKITNGDSLKILKELPDKSIDMILTDPPYFTDLKVNWDSNSALNREKEKENSRLHKSINKSLKKVEGINSQIKPQDWWIDAIRVSKKINWIIWLDERHQLLDYLLLIKEYGFKYYILNWYKTNPTPFNNIYRRDSEMALYIYNDSPIDCNPEWKSTLFTIPNNSSNSKKSEFLAGHPTPKPMNIIKIMIEKHTNKNDIILDIFSGSGTTAICAKQLNRQFIAIELDKTFYEISCDHLKNAGSQLTFNF